MPASKTQPFTKQAGKSFPDVKLPGNELVERFLKVPYASPKTGKAATRNALLAAVASLVAGGGLGMTVAGRYGRKTRKRLPPEALVPQTEDSLALPYPQQSMEALPKQAAVDTMYVGDPDWWKSKHSVPTWAIPLIAGAGYGGAKGGSAIINSWVRKKRRKMMDEKLRAAESSFEDSLVNQYKPENIHELQKVSSGDPLDRLLDTKVANFGPQAGWVAGSGLTIAAIIAALAAKGGYKLTEGRSQDDLLMKALKHEQYLKSLRNPESIAFAPTARMLPPKPEEQPQDPTLMPR